MAPGDTCGIRKKVLANTYQGDEPLSFVGTGGQLFGIMIKNLLLTLITLGIYGLFMFPVVNVLKWDAENTRLPGERRLEYRGTALDLFGQVLCGHAPLDRDRGHLRLLGDMCASVGTWSAIYGMSSDRSSSRARERAVSRRRAGERPAEPDHAGNLCARRRRVGPPAPLGRREHAGAT